MEKGTILYIGGFELPDKNAAAHRVLANAKILNSLGYETLLIGILKNNKNKAKNVTEWKEFEGLHYRSIPYPTSLKEWLEYLTSIKFINLQKIANVKLIIAYNYPGIALWKLHKFCRKNNIKLVADCTEWYEPKGNPLFKIAKGLDVHIRMKLVHPKIDGMIVISDYLFDFYKDKLKNVINVPPLVDLSMQKWKLKSKTKKDGVKFIYAGSPGNGNKDRIDKIIQILSNIRELENKNFELIIVGITREQYLTSFGLNRLPINADDFILFKGRLPHLETLEEIKKSDFSIFIRERNLTNTAGFPTKFVESISCGTPVITNSSSNIEKFLVNNKTGFLINIEDDSAIKKQLNIVLDLGPQTILKMKDYCKEMKLFDISKYSITYSNFIKNVLSEKN
ncbi:glycosyltransferase [Mesonia sp. K4-1]|uniref:glycosyltransferase n=1 Tax=Mesonia sp. K4-1 TaxID=2602760 RepID=UPI0011CCC989|nr:glycosyltransferase [Mesonia sp. K4-1]TXK77869.1 glycosyltransferase family 4 protein [Mesonia sp. K4-1]